MRRKRVTKVHFVIKIGEINVKVCQGDISLEKVDCVVNAANRALVHGGGVAGAIKRRGGEKIVEECQNLIEKRGGKWIPVGRAVYTSGGDMFAKYCIHAVGPIWKAGNDKERIKMKKTINSILKISDKLGIKKLSIPSISSGVFGYPKDLAVNDISETVAEYLQEKKAKIIVPKEEEEEESDSACSSSCSLKEIRFTNIDERTSVLFVDWWKRYSKKKSNNNRMKKTILKQQRKKSSSSSSFGSRKNIHKIRKKKNNKNKKKKKKINVGLNNRKKKKKVTMNISSSSTKKKQYRENKGKK